MAHRVYIYVGLRMCKLVLSFGASRFLVGECGVLWAGGTRVEGGEKRKEERCARAACTK